MKKTIELPKDISQYALFSLKYDENDSEIKDFVESGNFEDLVKSAELQQVFHSDLEAYHWFFDYQFNDLWVSGGKFHWGAKETTKITLELSK